MDDLRARLEEAEQTLDAIRGGQVDAMVIQGPEGERVFTLEGADHRYRRLVETMNEGAAIVGRDGTLLYCNRRLSEMIGIPLERFIGSTLAERVDRGSARQLEALMRVGEAGTSAAEISFRREGDGSGLVPTYVSVMPTGDNEHGGVCLVVTDLTDQKRNEEIVASELLAVSILDQAAEAIVVCDTATRIIRASQAAHRLAGQNVLLKTFREVFPIRRSADGDEIGAPSMLDLALAGESLGGIDAVLGRGREAQRHVLVSAAPLSNARGEVLGCVVSLTDITERKRSENALGFLAKASVALGASLDPAQTLDIVTRLVVPELADFCAIYVDSDRGATTVEAVRHVSAKKTALLRDELARHLGPNASAHVGYARTLVTGQGQLLDRVAELTLHELARDEAHLALLRAIGPRSVIVSPLTLGSRTFGALVVGRTECGAPFTSADASLVDELALRAAAAITNARLYELARRERERGEEANRAKDEFLATVSHELRTPLNAMLGWTRMLRAGQVPPEKQERALATIERSANAQTQLIEDLLDLSRIISGKLRLDVRPVELGGVIRAALDGVRLAADARGVRLQATLDPNAGPIVGDPDRLQQIVWNLLSNAIKFTERGGQVDVQLRSTDAHVEVAVSDSGIGIAQEFLPHVFERFRQADGSRTRSHGGLGLGLTIVRNLVEQHGGTVDALSAGIGTGATFRVKLPLLAMREDALASAPPPPLAAARDERDDRELTQNLDGLRILVVDDAPDARELLTAVLEQRNAVVLTAASAAEAIEEIVRHRPDVLVSDIGMPNEDGYSLIARVRALSPEDGARTPAVALTAFARGEDRARALRAGFDMHIPKPVEPNELVIVVAGLAGRRQRATPSMPRTSAADVRIVGG